MLDVSPELLQLSQPQLQASPALHLSSCCCTSAALTPSIVGPSSIAPMNTTCFTLLRLLKPRNLQHAKTNARSMINYMSLKKQ